MDEPVENSDGDVPHSSRKGADGRILSDSSSETILNFALFWVHFFGWFLRWTVAAVFCVAIMGGTAYFVFNQAVKGEGYIEVPNVIGMPITKAANIVAEAGLELGGQKQVVSDHVPEYHVIFQRPSPRKVVRSGRKVSLTISAGLEYEETPNLIGQRLDAALQRLATTRLLQGSIARIPSDTPADTILSQDPAPLRPLAFGGEIHLLVSDGPESQAIIMPELVGKSIEEAQLLLAALNVSAIPYKVDRPGAEYEVILGQTPPAGTFLPEFQEVTFDVRLLPSSFLPNARRKVSIAYTVPDVSLSPAIRVEVIDHLGNKKVIYPLPSDYIAGAPPQHPPGTTITFTDIGFSNEATVEFYADDTLQRSYFYVGDADPVITKHEAAPEPFFR